MVLTELVQLAIKSVAIKNTITFLLVYKKLVTMSKLTIVFIALALVAYGE